MPDQIESTYPREILQAFAMAENHPVRKGLMRVLNDAHKQDAIIKMKGYIMFYKAAILSLFLTSFISAQKSGFQYEGVSIQMIDTSGHIKHVIVKRDIPDECKTVPINNTMVWTGN